MMPIKYLKSFLEKIDRRRDKLLFPLIKSYWPRCVTPNHLSILRIVIGIAICALLLSGFTNKTWIVPFFCFALLLDLFDGSVARALNKKTEIGAFLDSFGDRVLIIPIAVYSLVRHYKWLLLFLILPEVICFLGTVYYKTQNKMLKIEANIFGKTKMVLESVAFGIILLNLPFSPPKFSVILLFLAVVFAFFSFLPLVLNFSKNKE